jgi:MFS superfamily sulfate permease-like transporter
MAGCALIGQSIINVKSGGRGRLSTFWAGLFLLILILVLRDWVARIPMAALVAVMIMVSFTTFDWSSVLKLRSIPAQSTIVMLATTLTVLATHDLAKGVVLGVLLSVLFFARKVGKMISVKERPDGEARHRRYVVEGPAVLRVRRTVRGGVRIPRPSRAGRDRHDERLPVGRHRRGGSGQGGPALSSPRARKSRFSASTTQVRRWWRVAAITTSVTCPRVSRIRLAVIAAESALEQAPPLSGRNPAVQQPPHLSGRPWRSTPAPTYSVRGIL